MERRRNTQDLVGVVTAKKHSSRLPEKNFLPLNGEPIAHRSVLQGIAAGLKIIVYTDSQPFIEWANNHGCMTAPHPSGLSHADVIRSAMTFCGKEGFPCVLLQPTSPFRAGGIIQRCLSKFIEHDQQKTVLTANHVHDARLLPLPDASGRELMHNAGHESKFWDGNVAVFPAGRICDFKDCVSVRNLPMNSLQIDTEADYVSACVTAEMLKPVHHAILEPTRTVIAGYLTQFGIVPGTPVTVVCRESKWQASQEFPVVYVNHCRGYDGGRCDGVFIIANTAHKIQGISAATRECVTKARFVIVRDNGELNWLLQALPESRGKAFTLRACLEKKDDHLTSGAMAVDLFSSVGCRVRMVGGLEPGKILDTLTPFHLPAMSREIALLWSAGAVSHA